MSSSNIKFPKVAGATTIGKHLMPFPPRNLSDQLISKLERFLDSNNFLELYESYSWGIDSIKSGFSDILKLEAQLTKSEKTQGISLKDVMDVARWGKLRNLGRIIGKDIVLPPNTLHSEEGEPATPLNHNPTRPIKKLESNIERGIGPTYLSKILRFGLPQEYGAIDTRCVRVFGEGDATTKQHDWLSIRVRNDGYGWYIPKTQSAWPSAYGAWIDILRFFSDRIPNNCQHPQDFIKAGLRSKNEWTCADVEMALFSYVSHFV